jgi:DNA-directed RNA polymerase specialized sigma24 family protein
MTTTDLVEYAAKLYREHRNSYEKTAEALGVTYTEARTLVHRAAQRGLFCVTALRGES